MFSNGLDDKTVYIGTAKGNNYIKIYNKKKESSLNITGDLTRLEITVNIDNFLINDIVMWNYDTGFPDLFLNNYVYSLSDFEDKKEKDKTLFAILYAVQNRL